MFRLLDVLVHVLVLGGIAAADMTADQAHAKIGPAVAQVKAILADVCAGFTHLDQLQVGVSDLAGEGQFEEEFRNAECRGFGYFVLLCSTGPRETGFCGCLLILKTRRVLSALIQ